MAAAVEAEVSGNASTAAGAASGDAAPMESAGTTEAVTVAAAVLTTSADAPTIHAVVEPTAGEVREAAMQVEEANAEAEEEEMTRTEAEKRLDRRLAYVETPLRQNEKKKVQWLAALLPLTRVPLLFFHSRDLFGGCLSAG